MPSKSNPRISEAGAPDISDWGPACQAVLTNKFLAEMCQLNLSVPVSYDKDIYGEGLELIKQLCWEKLSGHLSPQANIV